MLTDHIPVVTLLINIVGGNITHNLSYERHTPHKSSAKAKPCHKAIKAKMDISQLSAGAGCYWMF